MQQTNKIIVAGPRNYFNIPVINNNLNILLKQYGQNIEIVTGGAQGVDNIAEFYARANNIKLITFLPQYHIFNNKSAPIIRNSKMAQYANILIAFSNGKSKGTAHMVRFAQKYNLIIHIVNI